MTQTHSCLQNSKTNDTRSLGKRREGTRRRRECRICGRLFTTREVEVDTLLSEVEQAEHKQQLTRIVTRFKTQFDKFVELVEEL